MTTDRTDYTNGLRQLAGLLDSNPDLPLPYTGNTTSLDFIEFDRPTVAAIIRALPGKIDKQYEGTSFRAFANVAGLKVGVLSDRATVCERRVVGTETVEIPAVEAATVTRDIVEWDCHPLLAEDVTA